MDYETRLVAERVKFLNAQVRANPKNRRLALGLAEALLDFGQAVAEHETWNDKWQYAAEQYELAGKLYAACKDDTGVILALAMQADAHARIAPTDNRA